MTSGETDAAGECTACKSASLTDPESSHFAIAGPGQPTGDNGSIAPASDRGLPDPQQVNRRRPAAVRALQLSFLIVAQAHR